EHEVADVVTAWRRWVDIMRAVPGNRFTVDWNPAGGQHALRDAERAYPGDPWVDRIALDVYDGWYHRGWRPGIDPVPTPAERDAVWREILDGDRGLRFWRDFAAARGKPLSFPEWGLRTWAESDGRVHGGGDHPVFVQRMHALISDPRWNVDYHAFWEDPGVGVSDPDAGRPVPVPASRAAFLRLFGATPTPSGPVPADPAHVAVARFYLAYLGRAPDPAGLAYWSGLHASGRADLASISAWFARSPEFRIRFGELDDGAFVATVYRNVLDRLPDPGGAAHWTAVLSSGLLGRGSLVLRFVMAPEFAARADDLAP
ncbi:MAG TPA: DUF4214 domain-containing protein, partial [Acidimicrobiales bacterium]|nr:DUF4214 domain-containing protein [Acidimicrobiales bacterium]